VNVVVTILVLLAPVALVYGWVCYFTPVSEEPFGWRKRATLVSLVLASVGGLLWPVMMWHTNGAYGVAPWMRVALLTLLVALTLGLLGRPRLILPIVIACIGTVLLWVFSMAS
jgi:hypothetical protein